MSYHLQMNGTSDWIKTNTFTFDTIEIDVLISSRGSYTKYIATQNHSWFQRNGSNVDQWDTSIGWTQVFLNGVAQTNSTAFVPLNTRCTLKITGSSKSDIASLFANYTGTGFTGGSIWDAKFYNAGAVVAHYDFTNQFTGTTVPDSSGNGNTATLTGGTWVNDAGSTGATYTGTASGIGSTSASITEKVIESATASAQGLSSATVTEHIIQSDKATGKGTASATVNETYQVTMIYTANAVGIGITNTTIHDITIYSVTAIGQSYSDITVHETMPGWNTVPLVITKWMDETDEQTIWNDVTTNLGSFH